MPSPHDSPQPILRPLPTRSWQLSPTEPNSSTPPSPALDGQAAAGSLDNAPEKSIPPSRTRSVLNLTSSTLFGIYSAPSDDGGGSGISQSNTPFGTGSMTPSMSSMPSVPNTPFSPLGSGIAQRLPSPRAFEKQQRRRAVGGTRDRMSVAGVLGRAVVLFGLGVAYGEVATRLHEETELIPVKMEGIDRHTWWYLLFWGVAGVVLGNALPWIDELWEEEREEERDGRGQGMRDGAGRENKLASVDWSLVVRGMGAFIGTAFAIRRLPWESSMQASLTLALANPALWYLVDRSLTGFLLSLSVGVVGAAVILGVNPAWVPSTTPATNTTSNWAPSADLSGLLSYEHIAVSTWVASVLFCSCVCFGNIGRILHGRGTRI